MGPKASRWKEAERRIAKLWGMVRAPYSKWDTQGHPTVVVEAKEREKPLKTILGWMQQAEEYGKRLDKIAVVQIHVLGDKYEDDICLIRAKHLVEFIGKGEHYVEDQP